MFAKVFLFPLIASVVQTETKSDIEYHSKLQDFLKHGLTNNLWNRVNPTFITVSNDCVSSLRLTKRHIHLGSRWAHLLIDSSSKPSSGILKGTIGSFGDYDQCLEIKQFKEKPNFVGSYSLVQLEYLKREDVKSNISILMGETFPVLGVVNLHFALCLPSTCSGNDVKSLVTKALTGYPFKVPDKTGYPIGEDYHIIPETKDDLSVARILRNFSRIQTLGLTFILSIISLSLLAIICRTLMPFQCQKYSILLIIGCFNPLKNAKDLFKVDNDKRFSPSQIWIDIAKFFILLAAILVHTMVSLEHFVPLITMYRLNDLKYLWKDWTMQPLNEAGFCGLAVIGSFYHFHSYYDLIKEGKLNFVQIVAKKYLRFIIPIVALISFELISPILGAGPIYVYVSKQVVGKCEQYWWRHIIAFGNQEVERTCAGYMFMTSVFIQLLLIGLIMIYLLARKPKIGVVTCLLVCAASSTKLYQDSKALSTPLATTSPVSVQTVVEFFQVAHFPTTSHLIAYTLGLLLTFALKNGFRFYSSSMKNSYIHLAFQVMVPTIIIFLPGLHNVLHIVPRHLFPAFILFLRFAYMTNMYQCFILSHHWPPKEIKEVGSDIDGNNNYEKKPVKENRTARSILNALLSISFSTAVINYPFTRWNQVTSRFHVPFSDFYSLFCRAFYSFHFVLILGFLFQIIFVSPFEKLINLSFDGQKQEESEKEQ